MKRNITNLDIKQIKKRQIRRIGHWRFEQLVALIKPLS